MYILYLFEAVYIAHDISLEKKGLECTQICGNSSLFTTFVGGDGVGHCSAFLQNILWFRGQICQAARFF
jgi:hypothetical protein